MSRRATRISRRAAGEASRPDDVAPAVGWLISDEAGWVSGQTIRADGALF
jgi:3-oxoacyl-[acyl-carrier protein] reductase